MTYNRNKNNTLKVGTFFSGIGSPEKALERLKNEGVIKDYKVEFFSEIDKNAIKSYCAIHNVSENLNLGNIVDIQGKNLPYCDLWIGGFPCQDISCAGKMKGFNLKSSTRSSLGWEMIRLLKEVKEKPKYVIFENVAMITSKKFKNTLELFKKDLIDIGYTLYDDVLCASDFGIPQQRKRYFLIAILDKRNDFSFPEPKENKLVLKDFLENDIDEKYYLSNDIYEIDNEDDKLIFTNKNNENKKYKIDFDKFLTGGVCGKDMACKFNQSSRLHSELGNAPTITASNTADNCKIVIGGSFSICE